MYKEICGVVGKEKSYVVTFLQMEKSFTLHGVNSETNVLVLSRRSMVIVDGKLCRSYVHTKTYLAIHL